MESTLGLSVSTAPAAWRQLRRAYAHSEDRTFHLTRSKQAFVDVHQVNETFWSQLFDWAVDAGLLIPVTRYRVTYFDDEMDSEISEQFDMLAQAEDEAEAVEGTCDIINTFTGTDTFAAQVGEPQLALVLYVNEYTDFDGLYWHDTLDVTRYSAPRGIILSRALPQWTTTVMASH